MARKKIKKKKTTTKKFLKTRIAKIDKILGRFETQVEKAVSKFKKRGEKSSKVLKKNFDEIIDRISSNEIFSKATAKKDELQQEIVNLAEDVVSKIKKFDLRVANPLLREIRANLDQVVEKLQNVELVEVAKDTVKTTRDQVLNVLNIPSQKDVSSLNRKVTSLEKKIKVLSRKAA